MPRRGAFTGFEGSLVVDGPEIAGFPGVFSVGLVVTVSELPVLVVFCLVWSRQPEVAVFSFGREVRNAPRTSSS